MNHSRAAYARLARELGGYFHPWQRTLSGPDPELTFDLLLSELLTPETRVLEHLTELRPLEKTNQVPPSCPMLFLNSLVLLGQQMANNMPSLWQML